MSGWPSGLPPCTARKSDPTIRPKASNFPSILRIIPDLSPKVGGKDEQKGRVSPAFSLPRYARLLRRSTRRFKPIIDLGTVVRDPLGSLRFDVIIAIIHRGVLRINVGDRDFDR